MATDPDNQVEHLEAELAIEEGQRFVIYDDATGQPFVKGMTLKGNLSVGEGINLMIPFDPAEVDFLERNRIAKAMEALNAYPWYAAQDPVRQTALADLTYNLGLTGLLHWPSFLHFMTVKDYPSAMNQIQTNIVWVTEVHQARATRIEQMILTGQWPADVPIKG
jgi:hypothetical protein